MKRSLCVLLGLALLLAGVFTAPAPAQVSAHLAADINPGPADSNPFRLTVLGCTLKRTTASTAGNSGSWMPRAHPWRLTSSQDPPGPASKV